MHRVDADDIALEIDLERRLAGRSLRDEGERLSGSLYQYVREAWHVLNPDTPFLDNWHIGMICEQLEDVSAGHCRRLLIWLPPGAMKTSIVSICWPTWEWTTRPGLRYLVGSYHHDVAIDDMALPARNLILSEWYRERWGHVFQLRRDANRRRFYANDKGGFRTIASPTKKGVATGRHFDRIIIDDPSNAQSAEATTERALEEVIGWHDGTLVTRFRDPNTGVEVVVQQRLHERDLSGHIIETQGADWRVLCLPYRYEPDHPFVWPDDPRDEKDLLWPERLSGGVEERYRRTLGGHRAAGQLQQRPAAREGEILKRGYWRYYPEAILDAAERGDISGFPAFRVIICDWDTSVKEKTSSDPVAGGLWGIIRGDRYLLKTFNERASLSRTMTEMLTMREWALSRWPRAGIRLLIENKSNGPDIIAELRRMVPGVTKYNPGNSDKTMRAEAAEPDFESGNVFICGAPFGKLDELGRGTDYDPPVTPPWAQEVIDQCASFPNSRHDDLVDMVTMCLNWVRTRGQKRAQLYSPADVMLPVPVGIPTGARSILRS